MERNKTLRDAQRCNVGFRLRRLVALAQPHRLSLCYLPVQRLKISAAFVPPKPNEFDSA